jgi:nucleoside-diphosphate-sugar epimerase
MEKDDFKCQLSFGDDVFGGPRWRDLVGAERAAQYVKSNTIPVMLDPDGKPVGRNFVHIDDLADAILLSIDHPKARGQTFNVCMDEPVNYRTLADHLHRTRGFPSVDIKTPFHSTWLDNTKTKFLLSWRPKYDLKRMIDEAFDYQRADDDPRKIWYPG